MFEKNTGKIYEVDLAKFFEERMFFKENPWYSSEIPTRKHKSEYSALEPLFRAIVQRENLLRRASNHTIMSPNVVPRLFDYRKLFTIYVPDLKPEEEINSDFDLEPEEEINSDYDLEPEEETTTDYYLELEEETTTDEARAKRHCANNRNSVVSESTASRGDVRSQQNDECKSTESAGPSIMQIWSVKSMLRKVVENRYGIFAGGKADDQVLLAECESEHEDMDNGTESNGVYPRSIDQVVSENNRIRSGDSELLNTSVASDIDHQVSFREVMDLEESELWREACYSEIRSHKEYETFELCELPQGKKALESHWVFGNTYKARLVIADNLETFTPVIRLESVELLLCIGAYLKSRVHQMDATRAFLNGELEEEIYVKQPEGFVNTSKPNHVLRLKKPLCGLNQAPRARTIKFNETMLSMGMTRCPSDSCIYSGRSGKGNLPDSEFKLSI